MLNCYSWTDSMPVVGIEPFRNGRSCLQTPWRYTFAQIRILLHLQEADNHKISSKAFEFSALVQKSRGRISLPTALSTYDYIIWPIVHLFIFTPTCDCHSHERFFLDRWIYQCCLRWLQPRMKLCSRKAEDWSSVVSLKEYRNRKSPGFSIKFQSR